MRANFPATQAWNAGGEVRGTDGNCGSTSFLTPAEAGSARRRLISNRPFLFCNLVSRFLASLCLGVFAFTPFRLPETMIFLL